MAERWRTEARRKGGLTTAIRYGRAFAQERGRLGNLAKMQRFYEQTDPTRSEQERWQDAERLFKLALTNARLARRR